MLFDMGKTSCVHMVRQLLHVNHVDKDLVQQNDVKPS